MATYWCHATLGNDSNDGLSEASPKKTLVALAAVMAPGDLANISGTYRESAPATFPAGVELDLRPAGQSTSALVSANSSPITGWSTETVSSVTVYKKTLVGVAVASVVGANANYETSATFTDPRLKGQLRKVGSKAALADAASLASGAWFAEASGSDTVLYVRLQGDANPSTKTMRWARAGNGINFTSSSGVVVRNGRFIGFCDDAAGQGYGVNLGSGTNVEVRNCVFIDNGYHATGCNGNGAAANVRIINCTVLGGRSGAGTAFVWYGESGNISGRAEGCYIDLYPMLAEDGTQLEAAGSYAAFFWHAGGTPQAVITDITIENCYIRGSGNVVGAGWGGNQTAAPSDWKNPATYPVKVKRCRAEGLDVIVQIGGSISFDQCILDASRQAITQGSQRAAINPTSDTSNIFFRSCVITGDTTNAVGSMRIFSLRGNVGFENCSVYDKSTTSTAQYNWFGWSVAVAGTFYARRTIWARAAAGNGFAISAANIDVQNCWYYNISATAYSTSTAIDAVAEWTATIDSAGIYGTVPGWRDAVLCIPEVGGEQRARTLTAAGIVGVNGRADSAHYGPYQFGAAVGRGVGGMGADTGLSSLISIGVAA